ncbi:dsDNA nuclease domain-containing protein [Myxococcus stipitatus]|uniref:SAVED domain-containing protein n=1 Tax=Myxococcus stipitatus TaxID=83455 RepID=UPI001F17E1D6|nr:dsDNA nuclease domain-containing protein [Myxococcus stipitatus]MCE9671839.1 dsDNA nuclease domain-containing protein [Myxococcus stipitatus]
MGNQSASRLQGDRFQHLYGWYELLRLLEEPGLYTCGFIEDPDAGFADDVTLYAREDTGAASRYVQVKFHVDQRSHYSWESLSEATTKQGRSLLHKLYDSWRKLRDRGRVEIVLVSNWGADAELGRHLQGRDHRLAESFFTETTKGALAAHSSRWCEQFETTPESLRDFFGDLRLRLGYGSITDLEEQVDERMERLGLRKGPNPRSTAVDHLRECVEVAGDARRITRESLRAFLRQRELYASSEASPQVSLWIHGWARRQWDRAPTVELDWTAWFDRDTRGLPSEEVWRGRLLPELLEAKRSLARRADGTFVDLRGKLPLSVSLAVGVVFSEVAGFRFRAEQPTRGEVFHWRSDAGSSSRRLRVEERAGSPEARALLVLFQLTNDARVDLERFEAERPGRFRAVLILEPEEGPGDGAVTSAGDAVAFAVQAREHIRRARNAYRTTSTHLIPFAPATSCLFLGQRLNALGTVVTYERTVSGGYVPFLTLETG